jgi:hypothetical protein
MLQAIPGPVVPDWRKFIVVEFVIERHCVAAAP